jgi:alkylation response protein AidB-like acyl-CoA dehydrogenase
MRFDWSKETGRRVGEARAFAEQALQPRGRQAGLDRDGWRFAARFGLFRALLPRNGASGRYKGALESAALLEAMGRGGADRGLLFAIGAHLFGCLAPLATFGTADQIERWDPLLREGNAIAALAVSEPAGNSTFENLATEATPTKDGFRITGEKTLVTNATAADVFIVLAREVGRRGPMNLTAFLISATTPGLRVSPLPMSGLPGAAMGAASFEGCPVSPEAVLGHRGTGLRIFSTAMQWERSCLLAGLLGAAERDLAVANDFLAERRDAGGPLLRHQALSHRLARMKLSLESARLMMYRAAWLIDEGHDNHAAAAMAKLAVSEAVVAAAEDTFRLLAGAGWRGEGSDSLAALADTHGALLASGTGEIQLEWIARHLPSLRDVA